jgi:hypothetical protein
MSKIVSQPTQKAKIPIKGARGLIKNVVLPPTLNKQGE